MSNPVNIKCLELEAKSSAAPRFAFIPILRGKTKTAVSQRIVKALKKSSFCSSSPLIKKLIVQNVEVCCIVIETSGTQSIKIICASVPYLLNLLSRANPKLKMILEDEKVLECMNFFKEADMESLLTSFCTATIIIQKGIKMCYPTLCIQLSRDALLFSKVTWNFLLDLFCKGLQSAFHFVYRDLGPVVRLLCYQNQDAIKSFARNLPVYALVGAKSLILFSLSARRVIQMILLTFKRSVRKLCQLLRDSSLDSAIFESFNKLQKCLKHILTLIVSGSAYQYFNYYFVLFAKWFVTSVKDFFPLIWKEIFYVLKNSKPFLEKSMRSALQSFAVCLSPEGNVVKFFKLCYNSKPDLHRFLKFAKLYLLKLYQLIIYIRQMIMDNKDVIYPLCKSFSSCMLQSLIYCVKSVIYYSSTIRYIIRNFLCTLRESYPVAKKGFCEVLNLLNLIFKFLGKLSQTALRYIVFWLSRLQDRVLSIKNEIYPCVFPAASELNSIAACASKEVIQKSYCGVKKVVPSLWNATMIVTPVAFHAAQEILISTKNSVILLYPVISDAVAAIRPEFSQVILVLLDDGSKAVIEVASTYSTNSVHLVTAVKSVSKELPIVIKGVEEVSVGTSYAIREIFCKSSKARVRVHTDLKKAVSMLSLSVKAAELEVSETVDELNVALKYVISDSFKIICILNILINESTFFTKKADILFNRNSVKILRDSVFYLLKRVFDVCGSMNALKPHLKKYFKQILNTVNMCFRNFYSLMPDCDLNEKMSNASNIISNFVNHIISHIDQFICNMSYEILHNKIPKLWNSFKYVTAMSWLSFCDFVNDSWMLLEHVSPKLWCFICSNLPTVWKYSKYSLHKFWALTCKVSPDIWECFQVTVPILWDYNRHTIQYLWNLHLQTCNNSWNAAVPITSSTWACALHNCPKIWVAVSENSKSNWELFCCFAEHGWDTFSETSFLSWQIFHNIVSKTWRYGIRPVTVSVCYGTSSVLSKSIKLSQSACTKTGKIIIFLSSGLAKTKSPFKIVLIHPETEDDAIATNGLLKKCIDFSRARLLKPNSKRMMVFNSVKNMVTVPSQIAGTYSNNLNLDQYLQKFVTLTKIPFIPMSLTYNLGRKLL